MREIKFRALTIDTKEMVYGLICDDKQGNKYISFNGERWQIDANTIGQYTGLKDAQGKEIYEGDIVSNDLPGPEYKELCYGIIKWHDREAEFYVDWDHFTTEYKLDIIEYYYVIGNIHENVEMIKSHKLKID